MIEPENECPTRRKRFIRHLLKPRFIVLALPFVLLLAACSQSTSLVRPPLTSAVVALVHQPTGTVDLRWNPETMQLTVTIQMTGLTPSSTHPAHIHQATSCQIGGPMLFALNPVVANGAGAGTSKTEIAGIAGIPRQGWMITVHNGPNLTPADQFLPIACVPIHNYSRIHGILVFHYILNPATAADQSVSGQGRLSVTNHQLTVMVVLHGLVPGSVHMEHIHAGTCEQQGKVLYPLLNLVADKNGTATATTLIPNITSIPAQGWYVNIHRSALLTNPDGTINSTNFDPIACGNVG